MQRKKYIPPIKTSVALTDEQSAKFDVLAKVWCNARNFCLYRLNENPTLAESVLVAKVEVNKKFPLHGASSMLTTHAARTAKMLHYKWQSGKAPEPVLVQPEDCPFIRLGDRASGITKDSFQSPDLGRVMFAGPPDPESVATVSVAVGKAGHVAHLVITQTGTGARATSATESY